MKHLLITLSMMLLSLPAMAEGNTQNKTDGMAMQHNMKMNMSSSSIKKVDRSLVCMVNNAVFETPQIPVEVDGKTYYGCCPMCKARLNNDEAIRYAIDPISGAKVDKATAIIGAGNDRKVYYFENEETFNKYIKQNM